MCIRIKNNNINLLKSYEYDRNLFVKFAFINILLIKFYYTLRYLSNKFVFSTKSINNTIQMTLE